MLTIRRAGFSDLDFIIDLEAREEFHSFILPWKRSQHHVGLLDENRRYLMADDRDGRPCAFAILSGLKNENDSIELTRIVVDRPGEGIGRRFLDAIRAVAFDELGAHRLWLDVFEGNHRAQRTYEAAGFVREGMLRDAVRCGDGYRSLVVMSMLDHENAPAKASGF
jgi:RimJ/RimL family protein N-acetyltransferase